MELNYFTCTLGQAKLRADEHASKGSDDKAMSYNNINEFIDHQASMIPGCTAVGFYEPTVATTQSNEQQSRGPHRWKQRLLTFKDIQKGSLVAASSLRDQLDGATSKQTVALLSESGPEFLFTWLGLIRLGHSALLIAPQCSPSAIASLCEQCDVSIVLCDKKHLKLARQAINAKKPDQDGQSPRYNLQEQPKPLEIPFSDGKGILDLISSHDAVDSLQSVPILPTDTAYLHHTSGTSTGIPKPIPQSHHGAVLVLPHLPPTTSKATFTTTPLYHGGIADLFRSWTSDSAIHFFPSSHAPITASNILRCLETTNSLSDSAQNVHKIAYHSSVPYVLSLLAEDSEGLQQLKSMELVGVGGAALPKDTGDRLAKKGVMLVSRFGSAEAGFLLSSDRPNADKDKDWSFLRCDPEVAAQKLLTFESRDDGLSELVIGSQWPHLAKRNREDGSYATSDLFEKHASIGGAWRYHSRADSQLTLVTGKKFDPAPVESAIVVGSSGALADVLVFGNGKQYPGVLLFRSEHTKHVEDGELIAKIWPVVEKSNRESASHARFAKDMLIPVPFSSGDAALEKSSKGTTLRGPAEKKYAEPIERAYQRETIDQANGIEIPDDAVLSNILETICEIAGLESKLDESDDEEDSLTPDTDLFSVGIDSVASVQIRQGLTKLLPHNQRQTPLPLTVVEDNGTVRRLAEFILRHRHGETNTQDPGEQQLQLMTNLVEKYTEKLKQMLSEKQHPAANNTQQVQNAGETIILTGATGFLGSYILDHLLKNSPRDRKIKKIILLLRGATPKAARERVRKALLSRQLTDINQDDCDSGVQIEIAPIKLSSPRLGLPEAYITTLAREGTAIIHAAWTVNFLWGLSSFEDQLHGLTELLSLARLRSQVSEDGRAMPFVFASSVASVSNYQSTDNLIPETILNDPTTSGPTGYARSKWVAEHILSTFATQQASPSSPTNSSLTNPSTKPNIAILRIGQLSSCTTTGVWNSSEGWPLMLSSVKLVKCLPELDGKQERLTWLPVDIAAKVAVDVLSSMMPGTQQVEVDEDNNSNNNASTDGTPATIKTNIPKDDTGLQVLHVLNPAPQTSPTTRSWSDLLTILHSTTSPSLQTTTGPTSQTPAPPFETVPTRIWLARLQEAAASRNAAGRAKDDDAQLGTKDDGSDHSSLRMLGFWMRLYATADNLDEGAGRQETDLADDDEGGEEGMEKQNGQDHTDEHELVELQFAMSLTRSLIPSLRHDIILNDDYIRRLLAWVMENVG